MVASALQNRPNPQQAPNRARSTLSNGFNRAANSDAVQICEPYTTNQHLSSKAMDLVSYASSNVQKACQLRPTSAFTATTRQ